MKKNINSPFAETKFDKIYNHKYSSPLIKWFQTTMEPEVKYRLGLMTYEEYETWQAELAAEERRRLRAESGQADTFWSDDEEARENLSTNDYSDFLSQNGIDVSNKTALDFEALAAEYGAEEPSPIVHLTEDEILANVSRDIHGGNILSEAEIAALFEAANNKN